ncbi:sensor histidine kinase inhibitor, KipI family [Sinosporangium album]|uniref:Sensor histidine kinase inhibitor, KipI family n=1 Tax=Sinosporangium album TaxID=504805 RepID=A0A1G7TD59_9ACTN|nr:5-oxoprolinase subunit PxpB [Sinosporangium album]SDG33032.1 sensor histidine kinase inhibitor, KipI family [Sinosporangium album]
MTLRVRRVGERGLLVETGGLALSLALDAALRADRPPEAAEIVPGPETVLVVAPTASCEAVDRLSARLEALCAAVLGTALSEAAERAPTVTIPVVYGGADLAEVAEETGLSPEEVVARHTASPFVVGWLGFAPGFAYLTGLDPVLHVPRLATPRTSVPTGSVAVAGPYSAVYPSASPGGWRLLGHTSTVVWDASADPPSLLRPGTHVRFVRT